MEEKKGEIKVPKLDLESEEMLQSEKVPEATQDTLQEQQLVNITIVDFNKREISLKVSLIIFIYDFQMVQYELILELREYLSEHVYTCFFTNYYLEHQGNKLSDYSDLSELDLETDNKIYMRAQLYDEKSARQHINRVNDIFTRPQVLNGLQNFQLEEEKIANIALEGKAEGKSDEEIAKEQEELIK